MEISAKGQGRYRDKEMHIRCTEIEKRFVKLKAKLCKKSLSDFLIESAYSSKIICNSVDLSYLRKVIYEINKVGNNINQIAKVIHEKGDVFDEQDIASLAEEILSMREEISEIIREDVDRVTSVEIDLEKIAQDFLKGEKMDGVHQDIED